MDKCPQEILDAVSKIIPKNWHIIQMGEEMVYKPNAFNILLWVYPMINEEEEDLENSTVGMVRGPINFYPISMWGKVSQKAKEAAKRYGDRKFGKIEMQLDSGWLGIDTFIHELAHVAAVRWWARHLGKKHRDEIGIVGQDIDGEPMHGPVFLKAYKRLIIRAEKTMGKKALKHNRFDLKVYKNRSRARVAPEKRNPTACP